MQTKVTETLLREQCQSNLFRTYAHDHGSKSLSMWKSQSTTDRSDLSKCSTWLAIRHKVLPKRKATFCSGRCRTRQRTPNKVCLSLLFSVIFAEHGLSPVSLKLTFINFSCWCQCRYRSQWTCVSERGCSFETHWVWSELEHKFTGINSFLLFRC